MANDPRPILESLPQPGHVRARLSELATEANYLRRLLRLLERRPRRQTRTDADRREVVSAS